MGDMELVFFKVAPRLNQERQMSWFWISKHQQVMCLDSFSIGKMSTYKQIINKSNYSSVVVPSPLPSSPSFPLLPLPSPPPPPLPSSPPVLVSPPPLVASSSQSLSPPLVSSSPFSLPPLLLSPLP
ncbi:unnamed protein product [Gadus morhua 'NCC']